MLVAERGGDIVGFAHATWDINANEGNSLRVYVAPDVRGDGIGRRLLEETCRTLFKQGIDRINAMVIDANQLRKAFYSDFGFGRAETTTVSIGGTRTRSVPTPLSASCTQTNSSIYRIPRRRKCVQTGVIFS